MDWSKYTDEGWYGDGAIRHFQRGHWYVPGDFNPAAALPVWPLLEALLFQFTGVSLAAARALTVAVFALILVASYLLLRRNQSPSPRQAALPWPRRRRPAPRSQPLLLRLHPPRHPRAAPHPAHPPGSPHRQLRQTPTEQGTATPKRTLNLGPRTLSLSSSASSSPSWSSPRPPPSFSSPPSPGCSSPAPDTVCAPSSALGLPPPPSPPSSGWRYYGLLVRPHYLADYRYLFAANAYTGITRRHRHRHPHRYLRRRPLDRPHPLSALSPRLATALLFSPRMLRQPLVPALLLWVAGYTAFLAYHNNLQPRYYLVLAVPLTLLVPCVAENLLFPNSSTAPNPRKPTHPAMPAPLRYSGSAIIVLALSTVAVTDALQTLHYVRTPSTPSPPPPPRSTTRRRQPTPPTTRSSSPSPAPTSPS